MRPFKTILYIILVLFGFRYSYAENFRTAPNFDTLYHQGKYESIIQISKDSLKNKSNNTNYFKMWLGKAYYYDFQFDSSTKYLNEIVQTKNVQNQIKAEAYIHLIQTDVQLRQIESGYLKLKKLESLSFDLKSSSFYPLYLFSKAKLVGYKNSLSAFVLIEESMSVFSEKDPDIVHLLIWYASISSQKRRNKQAKDYLDKAIRIQQKYFIDNGALKMAVNIFYEELYHENTLLQRFINLFEKELRPTIRNSSSNWASFYNAEYHRLAGNYAKLEGGTIDAIEHFELYIKKVNGVMPGNYFRKAEVYESLSSLFNFVNRHQRSIQYMDLAGEIYEHLEDYFNIAKYFWLKSQLFVKKKEYLHSTIFLKKIIQNPSINQYYKNYVVSAKFQLISNFYESNEYLKALNEIDKYRKSERATLAKMSFLGDRVDNIQMKCLYMVAEKNLEKDSLVSIITKTQMPRIFADFNAFTIDIFNSLAEIQLQQNNEDSALTFLHKIKAVELDIEEVLNSKLNVNMKKTFIETCQLIADANLMKYNETGNVALINEAISYLNKAEKTLSIEQSGYVSQFDRIKNASITKELYKRTVDAYHKLYVNSKNEQFIDSAFHYSELSKSAALLESVNDNLAIQSTNLPDSLSIGIESLKNQLSFITTKIKGLEKEDQLSEKDSVNLNYFKVLKITTNDSLESKLSYVREYFTNYYDANFKNSTKKIADIQKQLKPDELLIEFLVGVDQIFRFTISNNSLKFEEIPITLESEVSNFQQILQPEYFTVEEESAYKKFKNQSLNLYNTLIPDLNRYSEINRLFIVPDKHLNFLPFELLISKPSKNSVYNYKNLNYLIKDYKISYGYSSSLLFRKQQRAIKQSKPQMLAVAPSYTDMLKDTLQLAQLGEYRDGFEELLYNKEEVESIKSYFDSKVLSGSEATEKAVMGIIKDYNILHFAMHALVDNQDPENSKFVFTTSKDSLDDNLLHNYELYNTTLNCDLAVLSACNTGFGNLASGEGVMSLSRAFTYAGARSVVMSHWRVNDQSSSELMKFFYKELANGKPKDEALRLAKLAFLETAHPAFHHPFHWNNFVVVGDISPLVIITPWYKSIYTYLILLIILMSGAYVIYKKRKFS